jgi:hypothetical protein
MRRLTLMILLLALLAPGVARAQGAAVGPMGGILCNQFAGISKTTAATTALVNGVAGQVISVCGWFGTSAQSSPTSFQLVYGTQGGPCGSPVTLTPTIAVTSTAPADDHVDNASITVPQGQQLCIATATFGGPISLQIGVFFSQY